MNPGEHLKQMLEGGEKTPIQDPRATGLPMV